MFEVYVKKHGRENVVPFVSINPQGLFRFNIKSIQQYIHNKVFADVFIDRQLRRIGFTFVDSTCTKTTSMKLCKAGKSLILQGQSILYELKYKISETKQFELKEDGNIIYLQLVYDCMKH